MYAHPSFFGGPLENPPRKEKHFGRDLRFMPSSYLTPSPTLARQFPVPDTPQFQPPYEFGALQRKSHLCIPFLGIAWPQSQFPHSRVCERFIYIPRIGPHNSCSRISRSIVGISLTDTWMRKLGLWPCSYFSGNICFEFSVLVVCFAQEVSCLGPPLQSCKLNVYRSILNVQKNLMHR